MTVEETARKIRELEIQGATAVARESIRALQELHETGPTDEELQEAAATLRATRPTEPGLQNALDYVLGTRDFSTALEHFDDAQDKIREIGEPLIPDGGTVYTHCHSSTVRHVLEEAAAEKDLTVANTETRPVFQGRKTARELVDDGIEVHHFVDSAAREALGMADVMMIGADAITPEGAVYNKIGSRLFSDAAADVDVPVYVCTDAWKLATEGIEVEQRDRDEVWEDPPDGVTVHNPAFDRVRPDAIEGIVTEVGVLEPADVKAQIMDAYPELF
jgi:eIF-2B alpha/beta/delta-like uncharacterized protein